MGCEASAAGSGIQGQRREGWGEAVNQLTSFHTSHTPAVISAAGDRAYRFLEFFTAQIRTPHTRRAYVRAVGTFCAWLEARGVPSIAAVGSIHVAAYIEDSATGSPPRR